MLKSKEYEILKNVDLKSNAKNETFYAYHVVTDSPMFVGDHIVFDENHHSGVYKRVFEKVKNVEEIYSNPDKFENQTLEHHTMVALRELALEEVRQKYFAQYPSRLASLYVSINLEDSKVWKECFLNWKRPVYSIVKLKINGTKFVGDSFNCFDATSNKEENMKLAFDYWQNKPNKYNKQPVYEVLVSGDIEVVQIVETINQNITRIDK